MKLAKTADVVVENYRPDVKLRLGIDYESLKKANPRIVLASISGFGQDGPYRDRPGFDQIAQGMGGFMSITGLPGQGPVRAGTAIADVSAGLFAALGIMTALLEREVSGQGQWVQSSLLMSQIALLDFQAARYLMKGEVPRSRNRAALNAEINKALAARTTAEWIEILAAAEVPCGPIYAIDQMFADPQVRHIEAALKLSRTPATIAAAPPELGEHTAEVLAELGYDEAAIEALRQRKVI